ncbi:protein sidekick homolog [Ptychodera flava]|uniref:protein sidekick homolog n=1 Tax=Ptychodera flava TaxID=63121 RepID=UPI00396A1E38
MAICTLSTSLSLIILYAIMLAEASLDITSQKATFEVGDTIVINCTTLSHSSLSIQWFFNSNPINENQYTGISADLSQLVIPHSNFSNAGNYSCALSEEFATVQIQVGEKPYPLSTFRCFSFNAVDILCTWDDGGPTNIPTTSTLMYKGFYAEPSSPGYHWTACPDTVTSVNCSDLHDYTHSCFIYGYDHHHGNRHDFTVTAENALGTATTRIDFNPEGQAVPFAPSNITAVAESGTCVAVNWDYPCGWEHPEHFGYFTLQYRLRYTSEWDTDEWGNPITQTSREKRVCQLEGYTHYSIQLSAGLRWQYKYWSDWSDIVIVRTLEQAPISHLGISYKNMDNTNESSKRDVTVFWKPLGVREMKGEVLGYTITMSKEGENIKILVNASANATSHELQGLEKYASYNIQVVTFNNAGSSPPSSLTILDLAQAPSEPLNLSAVAIDKNSVRVKWERPQYPRGRITKYKIYWRSSSSELNLDGSTKKLQYEVKGLEEYVLYEFYVQAYTAVGGGGLSPAIFQYTEEGIPSGPPTHIQVVPMDDEPSSLQVTWQPPCLDERNGVIRGYILHFCEAENVSTSVSCTDKNTKTQNISAMVTRQLENLKPFTHYAVWLAAYTGVGAAGPNSTVTWNRTAQGTPSAPLEVCVTSQSSTEVGLEWKAPSEPNGMIKEYIVNYKIDNDDRSKSTDQIRIVLKDLQGYINYTIKVQACTSAVTSPCSDFSSEIYAKTLIGVPGKPNPPSVKLQSSREVIVTLNEPLKPNGPVEHLKYVIFYKSSNAHGDYRECESQRTSDQQTGNVVQISVDCANFEDEEEFVFATKAFNINDGKMLISKMSDPSQPVTLCHFMPNIALIVAMIIVGTILVIIMFVLAICCRRKYKKSEYALPIPDAKLPTSDTPPESPTERDGTFDAREVYDVLPNQKVRKNGVGPIITCQSLASGGHSDTSATSDIHFIKESVPDAPTDEQHYIDHQDPGDGLLALRSPDSGITGESPDYSGIPGNSPFVEGFSIGNQKEDMCDNLQMPKFGQSNNSLQNDPNVCRLMSFNSGISYSSSSQDVLMTPLSMSGILPSEDSNVKYSQLSPDGKLTLVNLDELGLHLFPDDSGSSAEITAPNVNCKQFSPEGKQAPVTKISNDNETPPGVHTSNCGQENEIAIDGLSSYARKNEPTAQTIEGHNEIVPLSDIIVMDLYGEFCQKMTQKTEMKRLLTKQNLFQEMK